MVAKVLQLLVLRSALVLRKSPPYGSLSPEIMVTNADGFHSAAPNASLCNRRLPAGSNSVNVFARPATLSNNASIAVHSALLTPVTSSSHALLAESESPYFTELPSLSVLTTVLRAACAPERIKRCGASR